jgi:hypothetical protein
MLPIDILDGGIFFFLTIWGMTGSQEWSKKIYSWINWFILLLMLTMTGKWFINFVIN